MTPSADDTWHRVVNSLSGVFCSSLNLLTPDRTFFPPLLFSSRETIHRQGFVYFEGSLPKETVCTENFTPCAKILPCGNRFGLASLLNPTRIFEADYSLIDVEAENVCIDDKCEQKRIVLTQHIRLVFNLVKWTSTCDWTIDKLFGRKVPGTCSNSLAIISLFPDQLGKLTLDGGVMQGDHAEYHLDSQCISLKLNGFSGGKDWEYRFRV
jgi:phosphatidylinositol glycan class T